MYPFVYLALVLYARLEILKNFGRQVIGTFLHARTKSLSFFNARSTYFHLEILESLKVSNELVSTGYFSHDALFIEEANAYE